MTKLFGYGSFLRTLTAIHWLSLRSARVAARAVPLAELALAALLVAWPSAGGAASLALLALFTGVVIRELAAGRDFRCGCFGGADTRPTGRTTVARNVLLAVPAAALLVLPEALPMGAVLVGLALGFVFLLVEVGLDTLETVRAS